MMQQTTEWYRMMLVIICEQKFLFYLNMMLKADPS